MLEYLTTYAYQGIFTTVPTPIATGDGVFFMPDRSADKGVYVTSMPRTIGMVMFRILAIGIWIFALLIFVGGLSTDFLTCTIVALIIALNTLIPSSQSPGARRERSGRFRICGGRI